MLWFVPGAAAGPQASPPAPVADRTPVHRLEVSVGGLWLGGASLGAADATLRGNQSGGTPPPYVLFRETRRFQPAGGVEARLGLALTRAWSIEGALVFARPQVRTSVFADVEGAAPVVARGRLDQYIIDAGVRWELRRWWFARRAVPFVAGGAGHLRQVHEGQFLIETGRIYRVGGGLIWWLSARDAGFIRGTALRVDGRVYLPHGGVRFQSRTRVRPAVGMGAVIVF